MRLHAYSHPSLRKNVICTGGYVSAASTTRDGIQVLKRSAIARLDRGNPMMDYRYGGG